MDIINLLFILAAILVGIIGGYYQIMLLFNIDNISFGNIFFGSWLIHHEHLSDKAKYYRKRVIYIWFIAVALLIAYILIDETMRIHK